MAANKGRLHGKFAVVTGAAQGIGRETGQTLSETQLLEVGKNSPTLTSVITFAREGCNVVACDLNAEALKSLNDVSGVTTKILDVTDEEAIQKFAKDQTDVDILFNCVG